MCRDHKLRGNLPGPPKDGIRRLTFSKDVGRLYPVSLSLRNHGTSLPYTRPPLTPGIPVWYSAHALGKIADHGVWIWIQAFCITLCSRVDIQLQHPMESRVVTHGTLNRSKRNYY